MKLPGTSHPLTDSSKFVVDTWQHPGSSAEFPDTLFVSVHGEYNERECFAWIIDQSSSEMQCADPSMAARSFDRSFILAPTPPGTPAANAGWPCVILSDMLVVRNWTNPELMMPSASAASIAATNGAPAATAPELVSPRSGLCERSVRSHHVSLRTKVSKRSWHNYIKHLA